MKISLIAINSRYTHSNLALLYLRDALSDIYSDVNIVEATINQPKLKILSQVLGCESDVYMISVYIWNRNIVEFLVDNIRQLDPNSKIVLGGPEAGYNSQWWFSRKYRPDFIIVGAGEKAIKSLAKQAFKSDDKIIQEPVIFSEVKLPYRSDDFSELKNKYIYYESSRGCPFNCAFCISSRMDQKLEYKPLQTILQEIDFIAGHEPLIVKFVDRSFNANRVIARSVWQHIIALKTKTKFHFEVHPALIEEEDLEILKRCPPERIQFEVGIQSTNPKTLRAINRNYSFDSFKENIRKLLTLKNIHSHLDLIIGLPYASKDVFINSLNDLLDIEPDVIQLGFLKVLPGTEMHEMISEYELVYEREIPYQILSTKWLSFAEMRFFLRFEECFEKLFNNSRLKHSLKFLESFYERKVDLYLALNEYFMCVEDLSVMNWKDIYRYVYNASELKLSKKDLTILLDYLRWDWLLNTRKNNLPDFLDREENHELKRESFAKRIKDKDSLVSVLGKSVKDLNHCAFFVPETKEFRDTEVKDNSKIYLFKDRIFYEK